MIAASSRARGGVNVIWRRVGLTLCALGAVGVLAGCSSPSNSTSASTSTTAASNGSTTSTPGGGSATTTIPNSVPNVDADRKNVTVANCGSIPGGWSAGGSVKNPSSSATTYHITIFFTSAQATDLASASTSVAVGANGTNLWTVKASFAAPSQVLCVLRGVSTS